MPLNAAFYQGLYYLAIFAKTKMFFREKNAILLFEKMAQYSVYTRDNIDFSLKLYQSKFIENIGQQRFKQAVVSFHGPNCSALLFFVKSD